MKPDDRKGKVILAGAGPGDPDLVTVKTLRYIETADVIVTDRLVSPELLRYCKPGTQVIQVGKEGWQTQSTSQEEINGLLVDLARQYSLVLRLKGGDVSFFSNILGELNALTTHEIPYEIVPGVTAASGAAAYAGFPLTAREYASGVRFLTIQASPEWDEQKWKEIATTTDTLVFYMSSSRLAGLVRDLIAHGSPGEKPMAIIEQATTPSQQVNLTTLAEFAARFEGRQFESPTIVIIGAVTALAHKFDWKHTHTHQQYFNSLRNDKTELVNV